MSSAQTVEGSASRKTGTEQGGVAVILPPLC